ncbi:leucine-rich repeat neuronal protein 3 [Platysternon megacephalum]|uniref:Leucine-rich repeat neuronal protein 3 n=1 Tax=Platysternon megacephalum TaxID=55544 RepID=A0A4D9EDE2_9SAUR|nr:leucine-rich repeat neuronal protein 3 [Platysternon megacephalum]
MRLAGMAAVLFGFEDLLYSWDSLVWNLTSRALRTCRFGNLRVLQLMLKPWCISRAVYQAGKEEKGDEGSPEEGKERKTGGKNKNREKGSCQGRQQFGKSSPPPQSASSITRPQSGTSRKEAETLIT